jgi:hypothetical protein
MQGTAQITNTATTVIKTESLADSMISSRVLLHTMATNQSMRVPSVTSYSTTRVKAQMLLSTTGNIERVMTRGRWHSMATNIMMLQMFSLSCIISIKSNVIMTWSIMVRAHPSQKLCT